MLPIKGKRERERENIQDSILMLSLLFIIVRLCENKLDLIKQALDSSPTAYKKYDKVNNNILKIILSPLPLCSCSGCHTCLELVLSPRLHCTRCRHGNTCQWGVATRRYTYLLPLCSTETLNRLSRCANY